MTLVWSPGYAPVDEYYDNVSLLLYGNGTNGSTSIIDSSPSPKTVTAVGNAQISTAQSKFGGASIAFDGNGDYLTLASNPNLALGSGDFTIEMWVYSTATGVAQNFLDARVSSTGYAVQKNSSNEITFYSEVAVSTIVNAALTANQWVHVAIVRSSGTITLYLDGTSADTGANTSNYTSQIAVIGARFSEDQQYYTGYIDDLRITKGVARYTSNFDPPTASFPDLSPTGRLTVAYTIDSDAAAYIAAVEAADGQALETATRTAIDSFVKGCKNDGIWNAIKASCILAGARTLTGALVPLAGTAPTNVGPFVSGDYNRETGLVGNGSTKYLNTNRNNNADPQDSFHMAAYINYTSLTGIQPIIGTQDFSANNHILITDGEVQPYMRGIDFPSGNIPRVLTGFIGASRSSSTTVNSRAGGIGYAKTKTSTAPDSKAITVFSAYNNAGGTAPNYTAGRIAFYSIGESLDLALLDTRVTSLINAFAAAIP